MIQINEINHASAVISSLDKIYSKGKISGKLEATDLYILNIIYKLLNGCCLELTDSQKKQLINAYRNMYFHSEDICHTNSIEIYKPTYRTPFFQAESIDCNDYPIADKIFYWQLEATDETIDDVVIFVAGQDYLTSKPFVSKQEFETPKEIDYINIGRICFAMTESIDTDQYNIYDSQNNDVTHTFDFEFVDLINTLVAVSQNVYSHGLMKFKIKKI